MFLKKTKQILESETRTGPDREKIKPGPETKTRTGFFLKPGPDRTGKIKTRTGGENPDRKNQNPDLDRTGPEHLC